MCATLLAGNSPDLSWAAAPGAITWSARRCTASRMACSSSFHWRLRSSCSKIFISMEHALAAVDVDGLAGQEAEIGAEQRADQPRHFFGRPGAGNRDAPLDPGLDAVLLAELGI